MRILVVEDSRRLRETVKQALENMGYSVQAEEDGQAGLWRAEEGGFDAIVLDIMLPGLDGFQILKRMRDAGNDTPVLCLTARDTLDDRVKGLTTGADDYLVKPFELRELLARVHALCRRRYGQYGDTLQVADLVLDRVTKRVTRGEQEVVLRPREYAILEYLMLRPNEVVSRKDIERHVYDDIDAPMSNVVDSAMCAVRRKIAVAPETKPLIHTRRGHGYVLGESPS